MPRHRRLQLGLTAIAALVLVAGAAAAAERPPRNRMQAAMRAFREFAAPATSMPSTARLVYTIPRTVVTLYGPPRFFADKAGSPTIEFDLELEPHPGSVRLSVFREYKRDGTEMCDWRRDWQEPIAPPGRQAVRRTFRFHPSYTCGTSYYLLIGGHYRVQVQGVPNC